MKRYLLISILLILNQLIRAEFNQNDGVVLCAAKSKKCFLVPQVIASIKFDIVKS